jgi:CAAX prenyl protease-like protein
MHPVDEKQTEQAVWSHVLPFIGWLVAMAVLGPPAGWKYAIRVAAGLALLAWLRPWRFYAPPRPAHVLPALVVGTLVFVVWIGPETAWFGARFPRAQDVYLRFAVGLKSWGRRPDALDLRPYAPDVCGWPATVVRLLGSAGVIALIEEVFWRGFLYRRIIDRSFCNVDLGRWHGPAFALVVVLFGLEHTRWLAGILAGVAYAVLLLRTRDLWAAVLAHAVTNLLLGLYVLRTGAHQFW